jgi:phage terminase large subunit
MKLSLQTPRVFMPLLKRARYKGVHGGRGSGKSHFFAELLIEECLRSSKRVVCIREVQKSIKQSVKRLLEDKIRDLDLSGHFVVLDNEIRCVSNESVITFQGMQDHTAASIKSLEGYDIAWCEEAQAISERSLRLLRPTIRKEGSEIWFSWNPENETDPVDELLRGEKRLENSIIVEANWMDNPFFPEVLRVEMEQDRARDPDNYGHVWLGEYQRFAGGAIYGREMINAVEAQPSRVTSVPYNPAFPVITAWDLGYGDATAIWFCQIVGREPRLIDYYENNLLPLSHYVQHIKDKPYSYDTHVLPHDAGHASLRTGTTLAKQLEDLGLGRLDRDIVVLPVDSVESGIQLGRNLINQTWFDRDKCKQGIAALRKYHYEYDEDRKMFKNRPHHDWSSNGADSFRYLSTYLATRRENVVVEAERPMNYFNYMQDGGTGWMG